MGVVAGTYACIWQLSAKDTDYSTRWGLIKKEFTQQIKGMAGNATLQNYSSAAVRERSGKDGFGNIR